MSGVVNSVWLCGCLLLMLSVAGAVEKVRFATFNIALYRDRPGALIDDLCDPVQPQARVVAEIVQRVRPDVLLLNEIDYDAGQLALALLHNNFFALSQHQQPPIRYPFRIAFPSNTGVGLGEGDGSVERPHDAHGYGEFPGQYGFALLSKYPLLRRQIRTFQRFLWRDMPAANIPPGFYSEPVLKRLRLSSKNHVDVPVRLAGGGIVHVLACHPTPPVFDGPENRNGRRNYDEIRLFADYLDPATSTYLIDDNGVRGGLKASRSFMIMGDMNADPVAGDSFRHAIRQLLSHPKVNTRVIPASEGGLEDGRRRATGPDNRNNPAWNTAIFNAGLRVDYVLPSKNLTIVDAGVFWPVTDDEAYRLVAPQWLDHRLVWVDIQWP